MSAVLFRSYFLCTTPRSGSTLLCDLLAATGVAGRPESYFRKPDLPAWSKRLHVPSEPDVGLAYLSTVQEYGAAGTGLFGCRIMWESMAELLSRLDVLYPGLPGGAAPIEQAFGPTLYVHLTRADKAAQAVSLLKALQSGLWHRNSDGTVREGPDQPQATSYDAALIAEHFDRLSQHDGAWRAWFAESGITPVTVGYDALIADPQLAVAEILSALGLDRARASNVKPRTAKLAEDDSLNWIERFRAEAPQTCERRSSAPHDHDNP
jgi:LPS sulfotransferase NodH